MKILLNKTLIGLSCLLAIPAIATQSSERIYLGKTYEIKEKNPTEEIQSRAKKMDWKTIYQKGKKLDLPIVSLSRATKNRTFIHEVMNTIEMDVKDPRTGLILYPKGYTFNPLEYIQLPTFYIIENNEKDIIWLKNQEVHIGDMVLTTGDPFKLAAKIGKKVMILKQDMKDKLKLENLPARVSQIGSKLKVEEFKVPL